MSCLDMSQNQIGISSWFSCWFSSQNFSFGIDTQFHDILYFQSQACIMLTPRMPLYIPLVYNVFLYSATVAAWRLNLRPLPEAALTGLMGEMIYAPYDVTGKSINISCF